LSLESTAPFDVLRELPELVLGRDPKATALVIGPGLDPAESSIWESYLDIPLPKIVDASALKRIPKSTLRNHRSSVFTPHAAEAASLFDCESRSIDEDRIGFLRGLVGQICDTSCLVLKGSGTLILAGSRVFLVPTGSVAQANAGQGDLLAGIIGALLAQGLAPSEAAQLACLSVGAVADSLSRNRYPAGVLAHEIADELSSYWSGLRSKYPSC
jgi:ADP-dependent NAD(P)H-hydrate dehydratase / NAD(P)H-hydrate epimerase